MKNHLNLAFTPEEERKNIWLIPGSKPFLKLKNILEKLLPDIPQMSSVCQTSSVEAYHAVVVQFAPKYTHYSFNGMKARLLLAALHFNENSNRLQATTKNGSRRWNIYFPKFKPGEFSVRPIMSTSTYEYVGDLLEAVLQLSKETYKVGNDNSNLELGLEPDSLCSTYLHPEKEVAVAGYEAARRFN